MRAAAALLLGLALALASAAVAADDPKEAKPPPAEPTVENLHGLRVSLVVPLKKPEDGYSLLLFFHTRAGTGKDAVAKLAPFVERGFILAAPWAKQLDWTAPELESAKAVAKDLCDKYEVPREHRHVAGMWSGAEGVPILAFDEGLGCRTATWIDSGWGGGSVAKWAKEELNGLFIWGAREGPSRTERFKKSSSLLAERVKTSLAHGEDPDPGLGRSSKEDPEFPDKLLPFWGYFMESMEGRFAPGYDHSSDWKSDLEEARSQMADRKTGGFVYVYSEKPEKAEWERTRVLQNEVLFDRVVRHFSEQLVPVKLEKGKAKELLDAARVTETPAIIVYKKGGKEILKAASGEIPVKALIPLLRAVSPDQELPK
jgi:hypothetical protein